MHLPHGCRMVWSYFGGGHGKGDHDGASVVLKQEIRKEQMNMDSVQFQKATNVVAFFERKKNEHHVIYPKCKEGCGLILSSSKASRCGLYNKFGLQED